MSGRDDPAAGPVRGDGARTAVGGTAFAVDVSRDRRAWSTIALFLAGPVIWSAHFMFVYLIVEAGCAGEGPGLELLGPPVPTVVTLAATAVAAMACLACSGWAYRRWRARQGERAAVGKDLRAQPAAGDRLDEYDRGGSLAFAAFLLSLLGCVTVLFVGLPALVLPAC